MTLEQVATFIGWMLLINILLLIVGFLKIKIFKKAIKKVLDNLMGNYSNKFYAEIPKALIYYEILIVIFNLVPYLALQIMISCY